MTFLSSFGKYSHVSNQTVNFGKSFYRMYFRSSQIDFKHVNTQMNLYQSFNISNFFKYYCPGEMKGMIYGRLEQSINHSPERCLIRHNLQLQKEIKTNKTNFYWANLFLSIFFLFKHFHKSKVSIFTFFSLPNS